MERRLIDYLPYIIREYAEFQAMMAGEQPEFERVWQAADRLLEDQFLLTAGSGGLPRWENMLQIVPKATDGLEERRFRILTRLNGELPYTLTRLREILQDLCGEGNFVAAIAPGSYTLKVGLEHGVRGNLADVRDLLQRICPENLLLWPYIYLITSFPNPQGRLLLRRLSAAYRFRSYGRGVVFLDGRQKLDGSWMLDQGVRLLWLVRTGIRTAARMPHRLGPTFFGSVGGLGVRTEERIPLRLRADIYAFDNMGGFVRLDGREPLNGSWPLDQRPRVPEFIFGVRVCAVEPQERLWALASYIRVIYRTEERIPLHLLTGVYPFAPNLERLGWAILPRYVFREQENAPQFKRIDLRSGWTTKNRIVANVPVISMDWWNEQKLRISGMHLGTSTQETTGAGALKLSAGMYTIKDGGKGLRNATLQIRRPVLFNGTARFDGSRCFDGGRIAEISM